MVIHNVRLRGGTLGDDIANDKLSGGTLGDGTTNDILDKGVLGYNGKTRDILGCTTDGDNFITFIEGVFVALGAILSDIFLSLGGRISDLLPDSATTEGIIN